MDELDLPSLPVSPFRMRRFHAGTPRNMKVYETLQGVDLAKYVLRDHRTAEEVVREEQESRTGYEIAWNNMVRNLGMPQSLLFPERT